MMKSKYLLLMDPREDYLSLQESALCCIYGGEVISFTNVELAKKMLLEKGHPELIVIDSGIVFDKESSFYRHLEESNIHVPIIATTLYPLPENIISHFPSITAVIEKPVTIASFTDMVKGLTSKQDMKTEYIPVKTSFLLKNKMNHFDLFVKLSDKNFVKMFRKDSSFSQEDVKKLEDKKIFHLYLHYNECAEYLKFLEKSLLSLGKERSEDTLFAIENIEAFERIARVLKWTPEVLESAQRSVKEAIKILSKNKKVMNILKVRLNDPSSAYSHHIGLLTYLVSALGSSLGWVGETGQTKLALAALIHDVAVQENYYDNIVEWNKKACDRSDKSPEVIRYRMHPFDSLKILNSLSELPPDVDQIILQHHEIKDGTGFPRGISSSRIHPLASIFILVEDLIDFIEEGETVETSVKDFITWGRFYYDAGHFMKIFSALEDMLRD